MQLLAKMAPHTTLHELILCITPLLRAGKLSSRVTPPFWVLMCSCMGLTSPISQAVSCIKDTVNANGNGFLMMRAFQAVKEQG